MNQSYAALFSSLSRDNLDAINIAGGYRCFCCGETGTDTSDICGSLATGEPATVMCEHCGMDTCIPLFNDALLTAASMIQLSGCGMYDEALTDAIES
jgi:hypothetical protein